ncbi:hypothetical protein V5O48_002481 [Marasmius crinis-equi]|uniref:Pentatricopeptide repeat-containing protein n=1 Tax=Marasmius crinis-equi TaxID=585013 RepID=A0ABR3FVN6_9AGAR
MLRSFSRHGQRNVFEGLAFSRCSHIKSLHNPARHTSAPIPKSRKSQSNVQRNLEAHVLSEQLRVACEGGRFTDAVKRLQSAPLDAQNIAVWNTLIWQCMKAQRYEQAYHLYIDMKRRGFSPNIRTYKTMLKGYSQVENWRGLQKQFEHVTSIYQACCQYLESLKKHDPTNKMLDVEPIASYIRILGASGLHQDIFDVFYAMDTTGPLAPNQYIFDAMFRALSESRNSESSSQNAASAKLLWTTMLKQQSKLGFPIDSHLVSAAMSLLSRGRPSDQQLAFEIAREYLGLEGPGEPKAPAKIPLEPKALGVVLEMCCFTQRWNYATHFFERVSQDYPSVVDGGHVTTYIYAHSALRTPDRAAIAFKAFERFIQRSGKPPPSPTLLAALRTCGSVDDWRYATRAFDLATGYHCHDFMDGSVNDRPRGPKEIPPHLAEALHVMFSLARRNDNQAQTRQVLRLISHIGVHNIAVREMGRFKTPPKDTLTLAEAILPVVESLLQETPSTARPHITPPDAAPTATIPPEDLRSFKSLSNDLRQFIPFGRSLSRKGPREYRGGTTRGYSGRPERTPRQPSELYTRAYSSPHHSI